MPVNGVALGAVGVGAVFTYAGVKGISVPAAFQYIVQGKSPAGLPQKYGIDTPVQIPTAGGTTSTAVTGTASGVAIANDALRYKGQGYVWGGPADRPGNWDCSSFVSYVLGHDLGQALPGGKWGASGFPPHTHGPTTHEYATFGTPLSRAQVAAGDLIVWGDHHVGIAINNTTMISAQDQKLGTGTSSIDAAARYFGAPPSCRRVSG